jgi:hypothetical protein
MYGVPPNYESKTEDFLFFGFQSVSPANPVDKPCAPDIDPENKYISVLGGGGGG